MQSHSTTFKYTANYYSIGDLSKATSLWFVIHGYGQLASYFLSKFESLLPHGAAVVAPEGLSHFYLEDIPSRIKSGNDRVGASWMTKENRLTDIANYLEYLNNVYQVITSQVKTSGIPITILGFSQGAATASRWIMDGKISFNKFILWAGILPPDIDFSQGKERFSGKETVLVYGDQDPFLNDQRFAEMSVLSDKLGIHPTILKFEGKHELNTPVLNQLI